jgi:lysyl-tRNA synthetase class 2
VQIRLYAGETPLRRGTLLERIVAGQPVQPPPSLVTTTVASWPSGNPFPVTVERLAAQRHQRAIRRWAGGLLFLDGLLNVAVSASPPLRGRLHLVLSVLPLGVAQSAAAITAVAGIGMIMMARGVRRGQRRAWFLAVGALAFTVVTHLARGGGIASSLVAAVILVLLVVERRYFQATTDRSSLTTALPRLGLIAGLTVVAATIGIEASARHQLPALGVVLIACAERLVGQYNISLPDGVDDFIDPTLMTIGVSLIVSLFYLLTRPVVDRRLSQKGTSAERRFAELRAREIVRRHGRGTLDYFALRDDKQFYFFRDSLVAYAVYGGVALISPDPIGPEAERSEVFSAFRSYGEARGWTIGVMAASEEWLSIYHAAGMHYLYLGDEAIVDCQRFSLEGGKMKGLRQACTRLSRHGYTVEFMDPASIDPGEIIDILELITMLRRGEGERGFSMMLGRLFNPKDKGLLLTVVNGPDGKPAAVCQFVPSPAINGYSLDLMRRDPGDHPNGLIDYALCSTIAHLAQEGARGLSLNFAAFRSVLESERGDGTLTRVERWALKRLSGILPIESLWTFNAKYHPSWLPRYLVYPAAESFVPVVAAVLRAESITELPVLGRFLANDPSNRPGTVVPDEVLEAAKIVGK